MIELLHIAKSRGGKTVLADVNLRVERGAMVGICGPSGCGKTTILEIIAGALAPDGGSRSVSTDRIGYAFQDDCLLPWLTVEENMLFVLSAPHPDTEARSTARRWLAAMGLEDARGKKPLELSGGMRRRLNLARSLAIGPELLLLDEPFAFQDEATIRLLREKIAEAKRGGATVIAVSHELESLEAMGATVLRIESSPVSLAV